MAKYSDDDIRNLPKITCKIAADYLGISPMAVSVEWEIICSQIGFAVKSDDSFSEGWSYSIIGERLIAYKHGNY